MVLDCLLRVGPAQELVRMPVFDLALARAVGDGFAARAPLHDLILHAARLALGLVAHWHQYALGLVALLDRHCPVLSLASSRLKDETTCPCFCQSRPRCSLEKNMPCSRLLWRAFAAMALTAPCICFGPPNAALGVSKAPLRPHSPSRTLCHCTAAAPLHSPAAVEAIAKRTERKCEREGRRVALERAAYVASLVAAALAFPAVADSSVIAEASITVKENVQPPASG